MTTWAVDHVERFGARRIAVVRSDAGEPIRVYRRRNRWVRFRDDEPVRSRAICECARRALERAA